MTDLIRKHWSALCAIPRPSKHEQRAVEYVRGTAQALGLEWHVDNAGNIIVRKNASPGMEDRRGIILQSHLDMVPQKNDGTIHDFLNDPIETYIDEEGWMRARGTTLGADNGIGAAAMLAVLEDTHLKHGPIEALFTVDEEAGMTGARALEPDLLKGGAFINLDTEEEGEIYIGCAGGIDVQASIHIEWARYDNSNDNDAELRLSVTGLKGGHSGLDINLGRGNALKIIAKCMHDAFAEFDIKIARIFGGSARNAIPREAFCDFALPNSMLETFTHYVQMFEERIKNEFSKNDPLIMIAVNSANDKIAKVMKSSFQWHLFSALLGCPCGVFGMSAAAPGVVETSGSLGIVSTTDTEIEAACLIRSSADSERDALAAKAVSAFKLAGAQVNVNDGYPGWTPDPESRLLASIKEIYKNTFGRDAGVKVVHAGLECGIIAAKYPKMEFVSIGPTIRHPHSPDECLDMESVGRFWEFLVAVLERGV